MIYRRLQKGETIELPRGTFTADEVMWFRLVLEAKDNSTGKEIWAIENQHISDALESGYQYAKGEL